MFVVRRLRRHRGKIGRKGTNLLLLGARNSSAGRGVLRVTAKNAIIVSKRDVDRSRRTVVTRVTPEDIPYPRGRRRRTRDRERPGLSANC